MESTKQNTNFIAEDSSNLLRDFGVHTKENDEKSLGVEGFIGVLEVCIHQARDIHNICIYHKQDVYAKLCLTSDPEKTVSTRIINGGGQNPVFDENLQLDVRTIECSLKCEVWMLSRVKNYLEDQLLGFALVPVSDVLIGNRKLSKEFSLSSTDLFHSPAGFVQLSLSYVGSSPEVMEIPVQCSCLAAEKDTEMPNSISSDYGKIEFDDPKILNENNMMVTEYFGLPGSDGDDSDDRVSSNILIPRRGLDVPTGSFDSVSSAETPQTSVSTNGTNGSSSILVPEKSIDEKIESVGEVESNFSAASSDTISQPLVSIKIEEEQKVVQQDFVDMYMKSMQQFTESLAKMKLPMDIENGSSNSEKGESEETQGSAKGNGSRVFYGSRAFF